MYDREWLSATVRRKADAPWVTAARFTGFPKLYGTVEDETDEKANVRWPDGTRSWEQKRDLDLLSQD
jgi:hypothetical protein